MDSFAVSIVDGLVETELRFEKAVRMAFAFALAQALMPVIGWFGGVTIKDYIEDFDHWIAFTLLSFIGIKMLWESFSKNENVKQTELQFHTVLIQSLATSIDALVVGIGFAVLNVSIVKASIIIGVTTFLFSIAGLFLGKYLGQKMSKTFTFIGGFILIIIGIKVLIMHLWFQ